MWINPERSEGFWAAQKISHNIRCYDIQRIKCEETEPISYDLSTVLWPHHHYLPPGSGRLSWNNVPENIIIVTFDFNKEVNRETYNWRIFRQRHSKPHSRSHLCVCWFRQLQNLLFSPKNACLLNSVTLNQDLYYLIPQNLQLLQRAESTDTYYTALITISIIISELMTYQGESAVSTLEVVSVSVKCFVMRISHNLAVSWHWTEHWSLKF